jgi:CBS domain-containing protein
MTAPAITVGPDATFGEIVELLLRNDISGAPVVSDDGRLLGVVTEADLVSKEAYRGHRHRVLGLVGDYLRGHDPQWVRKAAGRRAEQLMTHATASVAPGDDLEMVARTMLETGHKRLPVVDHGLVVGVVSRHDLLKPFDRTDAEIAADIDDILASPFTTPEDHACRAAVEYGIVTLTGTMRHPSDVRVLGSIVGRVPGVVDVDNRLAAREPEPHAVGH